MRHCKFGFALLAAICVTPVVSALAYDGTNCSAPGNCWEPKPGFPDKVAGSKYDPKHDPKELAKQQASVEAMEQRNKKRVAYFKQTGKWIYEVDKIPVEFAPAEAAPAPAAQAPAPAASAPAAQAPTNMVCSSALRPGSRRAATIWSDVYLHERIIPFPRLRPRSPRQQV